MNSFYIQLYINPSGLSDRIAVGMFLLIDHHVQFDYSKRKWFVASKLLPESARSNVENFLKNVKKQVEVESSTPETDSSQKKAFYIPKFSPDYFEYLNGYANNLITYSDPKSGAGNFSRDDFEDLFQMLVDPEYKIEKEAKSDHKFDDIVYDRLENSVVKEKADIRYKVSNEDIGGIIRPHKVDYIGRNGSFFSGSHIDLNSSFETIEKRFMIFKSIVDGLRHLDNSTGEDAESHHVLYFNEPADDDQKAIVDKIRNDSTIKFPIKQWEAFKWLFR